MYMYFLRKKEWALEDCVSWNNLRNLLVSSVRRGDLESFIDLLPEYLMRRPQMPGADSSARRERANAKRSIVWLVGMLFDRFPYLHGRLYLFTFLLEDPDARLEFIPRYTLLC